MRIKKALTMALAGPFASALLFLAAGCTVSTSAVLLEIRENPSSGSHIPGVPFFPQDAFMCGPASLASVMAYYGDPAGRYVENIAEITYRKELKGTLPLDLVVYTKENGYDAVFYEGSMADLREKIQRQRPLILFLNVGFESAPVGHYIVVTGYNDKLKAVIAHNCRNESEAITYEWLAKHWSMTGYSTILVTPRAK